MPRAARSRECPANCFASGRVDDAAGAIATLGRIPARLVKEAAERRTEGQAVWIKARAENNFAAFAPVLERTVALQREIAEHVGYTGHPYDAACSAFEPDITWAELRDLYAELKSAIGPLLAGCAAGAAGARRNSGALLSDRTAEGVLEGGGRPHGLRFRARPARRHGASVRDFLHAHGRPHHRPLPRELAARRALCRLA